MRKAIIFLVSVLFFITVVSANKQMKLVAVADRQGELSGSVADLYLETHPGTGRVFMDTFPLTKSDTQLSTRFAKEIACDFLDRDCSNLDFFYTIRAESSIIGGPSAGAATALLTIAELEGLDIDPGIAITGTINNGGLIGPVGGVKEKVDGALAANLTTLMIPKGKRFVKPDADTLLLLVDAGRNLTNTTVSQLLNLRNSSLDLIEYVKNSTLRVIEVETLDDALYELTGKRYHYANGDIQNNTMYLTTMQNISTDLCQRTNDLLTKVKKHLKNKLKNESTAYMQSVELYNKSFAAVDNGNFYSSASFCFGANVKLNLMLLNLTQVNRSYATQLSFTIQNGIYAMNKKIESRQLETMTDLQAYMIIKERLEDAEKSNKIVYDTRNATAMAPEILYSLAYANERLYSADVWMSFFGKPGKKLVINQDHVRDSCIKKLAESEERIQYVHLLVPRALADTIELQNDAENDYKKGQYALCLFKASRAKAEADVILGLVGVSDELVAPHLMTKLDLVRKSIVKQQKHDLFPILAYSYYEYATVLKDNPSAALLYAEYALELSNLDLYFKQPIKQLRLPFILQSLLNYLSVFVLGCLLGIMIGYVAKIIVEKNKRKNNLKNKKTINKKKGMY